MGLFGNKNTATKETTKAGATVSATETSTERAEPSFDPTTGSVASAISSAASNANATVPTTAKNGQSVQEQPDQGERQETPMAYRQVSPGDYLVLPTGNEAALNGAAAVARQTKSGETVGKNGQRVVEQQDNGQRTEQPIDVSSGVATVSPSAFNLDTELAQTATTTPDASGDAGEVTPSAPSKSHDELVAERNAKIFGLCGAVYIDYDNVDDVLAAVSDERVTFSFNESTMQETLVIVDTEARRVTLAEVDLDELTERINESLPSKDVASAIASALRETDGYHSFNF